MRLTKITLALYSKHIDVKEISDYINLPDTILWYPPQPQCFDPAWGITVYSTDCTIEKPLFELEANVKPKMDRIMDICAKDGVTARIAITVKATCYADRPVISLPPAIFPFFEKLNAEISFDVLYPEDVKEELSDLGMK